MPTLRHDNEKCLDVGIEAYGGRGLRIAASLALLALTEERDDVGIVPYMAYGMLHTAG